jgi:indolepyruvate ferredoxin oxidoreductase
MKREFNGQWMMAGFKVLARLKRLRGTPLDIFGRTAERKMERGLISDYEAMLQEILSGLSAEKLTTAVELAQLPDGIRGYAHVKEESLIEVRQRKAELMAAFDG